MPPNANMKKKTQIVLWGCGGLLLLGLILVGGAFIYLNHKLDGVIAIEEASQSVTQSFETLERKYSFSAPDGGSFIPDDEDRLLRYLRVRRTLFESFKQLDALQATMNDLDASVDEGIAAAAQFSKYLAGLRSEFVNALEKEEMSATEFGFMTEAIYRDYLDVIWASEKAQTDVADLRERGDALKEQLLQPGVSDEEMRSMNQELALLKAQQAQVPPTPDGGVPSNQLLQRHRAEIESLAHDMLDQVVIELRR